MWLTTRWKQKYKKTKADKACFDSLQNLHPQTKGLQLRGDRTQSCRPLYLEKTNLQAGRKCPTLRNPAMFQINVTVCRIYRQTHPVQIAFMSIQGLLSLHTQDFWTTEHPLQLLLPQAQETEHKKLRQERLHCQQLPTLIIMSLLQTWNCQPEHRHEQYEISSCISASGPNRLFSLPKTGQGSMHFKVYINTYIIKCPTPLLELIPSLLLTVQAVLRPQSTNVCPASHVGIASSGPSFKAVSVCHSSLLRDRPQPLTWLS